MALAHTVVASGTGLTTASFSMEPGRVYTAYLMAYAFSATAGSFSASGWDEAGAAGGQLFNSDLCLIQALRRTVSSTTTGTVTFTNANTGVGSSYVIVETTGQDTGGTNGSGAIVQCVYAATTGNDPNDWNLTLAALADAVNNSVVAGFGNAGTGAATPSSGYTELAEVGTGAAALSVNYQLPGTTTPGTSNANSFADLGGVGIEFKAAGGGGGGGTINAATIIPQLNRRKTGRFF